MSTRKKSEKLTYAEAGVNIDEADRLIRKIRPHVQKTYSKGVIGDIGGFAAFFHPDLKNYHNPVLMATTDGVGTKLKIAIETGKVTTIGIDLVAMCVNDLIVHGGKPLFFLDYYATGRLDADMGAKVIRGIARGCREAECALIGGETAEMPTMYGKGDFDLAGFSVGIVEKRDIITGKAITPGDKILGLQSSGFHSNGFSLIRKVLFDSCGFSLHDRYPGTRSPVWSVLLAPTRIYVKPVLSLLGFVRVKGMAHITGGGFYENVKRILPAGLNAKIDGNSWSVPRIFSELGRIGNIERDEMYRTFNMGIGLVLITGARRAGAAKRALSATGVPFHEIGEVTASSGSGKKVEITF